MNRPIAEAIEFQRVETEPVLSPFLSLITFERRENRACELGDALTCRLLEEHLTAEDAADPGVEVSCPICGRPVICASPEQAELERRRMKTRRGIVEYERAARRGKHCRRVFFPRG